jgi:hypothetical protein
MLKVRAHLMAFPQNFMLQGKIGGVNLSTQWGLA